MAEPMLPRSHALRNPSNRTPWGVVTERRKASEGSEIARTTTK